MEKAIATDATPEIAGSVFLKVPTGEIVGVCLNCQKVISSIDPDDRKFFDTLNSKYATVVMPESCQLLLEDDNQFWGQIARFTSEDRLRITKQTFTELRQKIRKLEKLEPETAPSKIPQADLTTEDMYTMPEEELKLLAQKELKKIRKRK